MAASAEHGLEITETYARHGTWKVEFAEVSAEFGLSPTEMERLKQLLRTEELTVKRVAKTLGRLKRDDPSAKSDMERLLSGQSDGLARPTASDAHNSETPFEYVRVVTSPRTLQAAERFATSMGLRSRIIAIDRRNRVYDAVEVEATRAQGQVLRANAWEPLSQVVREPRRRSNGTMSAGLPTLGKD